MTTQMKAVDEHILMVTFLLLLKRVSYFKRKLGQKVPAKYPFILRFASFVEVATLFLYLVLHFSQR